MRITILAVGTRGDIQPYVALGVGLKAAGHSVCIATEANYQGLVKTCGLDFSPLPGNTKEFMSHDAGYLWQQTGKNATRMVSYTMQAYLKPLLEEQLIAAWTACQGTEAIISMPFVMGSYHIAERLKVPFFSAWTTASNRTRAFPHPYVRTPISLGGTFNWFSYVVLEQLFWQSIRQPINRWRQSFLGIPPIPLTDVNRFYRQQIPILYAFSAAFLPTPADWPDWVHTTGYWFLDHSTDWKPSTGLLDFLAAGAPPVYIGFGSTTDRNPAAITQLVVEAVARTDQRAVLEPGWADLGNTDLPPNIYTLAWGEVPHSWLFPQMAALVHHGGSGTTGAGLRAGKPTVVVYSPFGELAFVAQQVAKRGVGPAPIPREKLTVERLATAIEAAVRDEAIKTRSEDLGRQIRAEDGVKQAVDIIQRYIQLA